MAHGARIAKPDYSGTIARLGPGPSKSLTAAVRQCQPFSYQTDPHAISTARSPARRSPAIFPGAWPATPLQSASTASFGTSPRPVEDDATIEIVTRDSDDGLELLRHDAAHILAEAVKELWPATQVTIGPPSKTASTTISPAKNRSPRTTWPLSKNACARSSDATSRFTGRSGTGTTPSIFSANRANCTRPRLLRTSGRRGNNSVSPGRIYRSVPRPAPTVHGKTRQGLSPHPGFRGLLARRFA